LNKQDKNGIEWCTYTWSPVTGCLHGCEYCYAEKMARRFGGGGYGKEMGMFISKYKDDAFKPPYVLEEPQLARTKDDWYRVAPYPFGFAPTFHKYRLDEPIRVKKPQRIFVVSMGDLFGEWVPDEWQLEVYNACGKADWHKYLFLTKNPKAYSKVFYRSKLDFRHNFWLGTTVTDDKSFYEKGYDLFESTGCDQKRHAHRFLSIEPLLGKISDTTLRNIQFMDWVIIGQQTNPNKPPKNEWVQDIIDQCRTVNVPVFVKSPLYERFPIQEWPEGLRKEVAENG